LSLICFVSDEEGEGDVVHLGESMWPIHIVEVAAAVGGIVIKGAGGAGDASSVISIIALDGPSQPKTVEVRWLGKSLDVAH
jgi:hypothetical protein